MKKLIILFIIPLFLGSCATIWIPRKQKITFNTGSKGSEVYLSGDSIGHGKRFTVKVDKREGDVRQIVVRTKDYKDQYSVLMKTHRPAAFYPLAALGIWGFYGFYIDILNLSGKLTSYDKEVFIDGNTEESKLIFKTPADKYVNVSNIKLEIKDKDKDLRYVPVQYDNKNMKKAIESADLKVANKDKKTAEKAAKKKKKKTSKKLEDVDGKDIKYEDTKYSDELFRTLRKTGFIDTVNTVFQDDNNTLILEASITKITTYYVSSRWSSYYTAKVFLTWYVKNSFDEILDSLKTSEMSGKFSYIYSYSNSSYEGYGKMVGDAVAISYLKLHKNAALTKNIKLNKNFNITDPILKLSQPEESLTIHDKSDAGEASVIVKTKLNGKDGGHGSGFAITKDGYILTNYHVIAGRTEKKQKDIIIVTSTGKELPATLVRANKFRDIALLKVDYSFEKAFKLGTEKKFKNLQDVYTIGAPKSIELGQSVSSGIISNLRDNNNNPVLQLGMSVNFGNSGGPVFDTNGILHGVIKSKLVGKSTEGVSFAIPSYLIQDYLKIQYN